MPPAANGKRLDIGQRRQPSGQLRPRGLEVLSGVVGDDHMKVHIAPRVRLADGESADQVVGGQHPLVGGQNLLHPFDERLLSGRRGRFRATEGTTNSRSGRRRILAVVVGLQTPGRESGTGPAAHA
jgi:hypothetical protein